MSGTHLTGPLFIKKADGSFVQFVDANGQLSVSVDLNDLLDANGNEMLEFDAVASAVNYLRLANSATGNPFVLSARGDYTNVSIELTGKGTGYVGLGQATSTDVRLLADQPIADSSGNELVKFSKVASAVNELTISNNSTGLGPVLSATGETNVPITLAGKGTGAVILGQSTSTDVRLAADQPIADSSGNEYFKFSKTASAINELTIANGATAGTVAVTVTGSDTAVAAFTLTGKAAGAAGVLGGSLAFTGGLGNTTGAGGAVSLRGGDGGNDAVGGSATLRGGAAGGGNRAGGDSLVTAGAGAGTAAGGACTVTSGASANGTGVSPGASGAITFTVGAAGTATTGTAGAGGAITFSGVNGGASTGASSTAGAGSSLTFTSGNGGASSGGTDTGGAGGNMIFTSGAGGAGTTPGRNGAHFFRAGDAFAGVYFFSRPAPAAKTTSATLTVSEIMGGIITVNQAGGATSTQTTPTGTQLVAACPAALAVNDCFDFVIINTSTVAAEDAILGAGTDVTIVGDARVASIDAAGEKTSSGVFRFRYTGTTVWVAYRVS
mgnify:FL=1